MGGLPRLPGSRLGDKLDSLVGRGGTRGERESLDARSYLGNVNWELASIVASALTTPVDLIF